MSNLKKANGPYIPLTTVDIIKAFLGLGRNKNYSEEIETKHTPGPWVTIIDDITNEHPVMKGFPEHENICMVNSSSCFGNCDPTKSKANAKLIAAAPELLDALCAVLRSYEAACPERYYSDDNVALADDIIKKTIG